jgi:hypothetical protein
MFPIRHLVFALAVVLAAASWAHADTANSFVREPDGTWVTPFEAFPLDGTTPLFTGEYTVQRKAGLLREVQVYRDREGKIVHRVESLYNEVKHRPEFYESHDILNGRAATARVHPAGVDYEIRDDQGNVLQSGHQDLSEPTYVWPNLTHLVDENWDNGITGKDLVVDLFFSSLGSTVTVQVAKDGKADVNGMPGEQFKVVPNNPFIKLFVKPLRLVFSTDPSHRLMVFEGRSVVSDRNQKNLDLRIVFGSRRAG